MPVAIGNLAALWSATAWVLIATVHTHAQTPPALLVSPAQQAQRDSVRQRILEDELKAETAAVTAALQRRSERGQAGDNVGMAEAQAAARTHSQNIAALRRELDLLARPAPASPAFSPVAARRDPFVPAGGWVRAPARTASEATGPLASVGMSKPEQRPAWDMFRGREATAAAAPAHDRGVMWINRSKVAAKQASAVGEGTVAQPALSPSQPPAMPFLVYRDPNVGQQLEAGKRATATRTEREN